MGRPAWASEAQWIWLSNQAAEYMELKGDKKQTAKFWPRYLEGWKEQWPTPALTDLVKDTNNTVSVDAPSEADSGEVPVVAVVETAKKVKNAKKPLTVALVRITMVPGV
jgi:ribosomal protein S2